MACKYQYEGTWYSEEELEVLYEKISLPSKASPATIKKIKEFLERIGVDVVSMSKVIVDGTNLTINGIALPLEGLIKVAAGKEDTVLPEEAAHMAVELIEQKNPTLFKEMMNKIGNYYLYTDTFNTYKSFPQYQLADGKPNVPLIKKEAIGKLVAQMVINQNENSNENPAMLAQAMNWWQRVIDFLKSLFNRAGMNPFETAATEILEGDLGTIDELTGERTDLYQAGTNLTSQLFAKDRATAIVNDEYEVNGVPVRHTVDDKVRTFLKRKLGAKADKAFNAEKVKAEQNVKQDIRDILDRYIDDNGDIRATPLPHTNPSAVDPMDNSFYNTLEGNMIQRLASYPAGTKFFKFVNLYDDKTSTAGTADLIVVGDKVDIFQFKVPEIPRGARDIPLFRQEAYNIEVGALREILVNGYGVSKSDFDKTRTLPIKATYDYVVPGQPASGLVLTGLTIGNVDATLILDDILLPIPSVGELSGNTKFDKFISKLRGLASKLADTKVPPAKRLEKTQRIGALLASIRKLQVQGAADGIISSAKTIIRVQQEKYIALKDAIEKTDPDNATIAQLNKLASEILDEKDQVELYSDMDRTFKQIFTDGTALSDKYIQDAEEITNDAKDILEKFWDLSVEFRTTKLAARVGIKDEFDPEKQLSWYRRMVRSLSQSSSKAGAMLWALVKRINNKHQLEFQDRLAELEGIQTEVNKWMSGKNIQDLYHMIFQFDDKGRWTGKVIQKISRSFYTDLKKAQASKDMDWVNKNIDVEAYKVWYLEEHKRLVENAKTARVHEDDAENEKRIKQSLQDFVNTFSLTTKAGVNLSNYKLKDFPIESQWESDKYKRLSLPENEAIKKLYDYWVKRLGESVANGMIEEHNGWSWFPNVRRNLLEKLSTAKAGGKAENLFSGLRVEAEDLDFGKINPLTGKPVDEIHAAFVSDLGKWVRDADGKFYQDFSEKSMDIFKVISLWDSQIIKYNLKTESEGLARMLAYTEENRQSVLKKDKDGNDILVPNVVNSKYIKDHIDAIYYGRGTSNEADVTVEVPYKAAVKKINGFFGKEVFAEPADEDITISGVKALEAMNRFFVTKTLGLNIFTSIAQLFGGTMNTLINQGRYFDKKDVLESEAEFVSGRFWANEDNKKMAGLLSYFHAYAEDRSGQQIRNLSVSKAIKYLSSDHLFALQRGSDSWVNGIIGMAMIKNTLLIDGKLVNAREYAKKELGYNTKYQGTYEQSKEFAKKLDARVEELKKSSQSLVKAVQIVDDQIVIPGVNKGDDTVIDFRQNTLEVIKDALGNTSREDLSLYKRNIMWQSFFMFKNWIPRMADVRFQSLKFAPGTNRYEWGRMRMLGTALKTNALGIANDLILKLGTGEKNIIEVAKKMYEQKRNLFASQGEDFTVTEAEFIDHYVKGVRTQFKELILAAGMLSLLVVARANAPDTDEPDHIKGGYKWLVRGLDKLTDELSFFYNPISFTAIVNGSMFPAVGLLVEFQKFVGGTMKELWFYLTGDDEGLEENKVAKHVFKMMPITKELLTYLAIFNDDMAKDYGIRLSSGNGSMR